MIVFYVADSEVLAGIDVRAADVFVRDDAATRLSRGAEELFRYVSLF